MAAAQRCCSRAPPSAAAAFSVFKVNKNVFYAQKIQLHVCCLKL
jgi:hypothetical protein